MLLLPFFKLKNLNPIYTFPTCIILFHISIIFNSTTQLCVFYRLRSITFNNNILLFFFYSSSFVYSILSWTKQSINYYQERSVEENQQEHHCDKECVGFEVEKMECYYSTVFPKCILCCIY